MDTQNAIEIKNLSKHYPGFSLKDVSFSLPSGSIMGFIGENGAGKTTTIKALLGLIRPDSGTMQILSLIHICFLIHMILLTDQVVPTGRPVIS